MNEIDTTPVNNPLMRILPLIMVIFFDKQGWIMGVSGAIGAFAFGMSGLIAGVLVDIHIAAPLWLSLILLILAIITTHYTKTNKCK